jgi:hypothetical protein
MANPMMPVDGPQPSAPRYSLLSVPGVLVDTTDDYWINGVAQAGYPCEKPSTWNPCDGSTSAVRAAGDCPEGLEALAFQVYLGVVRSTLSLDHADLQAAASVAFQAREHYAVENEFMNAPLISTNPHLADGEGTFPAGTTAKSPREALALLEEEIAKAGQSGWIHMTPYLASKISTSGVLQSGQNRLETILGNVVVPGQGYTYQKGPEGKSADPGVGREWIYATGSVQVRRSQVILSPDTTGQAVDAMSNEAAYEVSRYYVVTWDKCLQAAVQVDRTLS